MADLKSMKISMKEVREYAMPVQDESSAPVYPYGLCLHVEDDQIEKLGMQALPEPGQSLMITARVMVTGVRQEQRREEKNRSIDLQITDLAIGPDTAKPSAESKLYPEA